MENQIKNEESVYTIEKNTDFDIAYTDKVWAFLLKFDPASIFHLDKKVRPENMERFAEAVKWFIREDYGKHFNFIIEFSSDYKRIRKVMLPSV